MQLKKYLTAGLIQFRNQCEYRADFIASFIYVLFMMVITYFIWRLIYNTSNKSILGNMTFTEIISYYWLTRVTALILYKTDISYDMQFHITRGGLNNYLSKPVIYPLYMLAKVLSLSLLFFIFACPVFVLGSFIFQLYFPERFILIIFFLISLLLSISISFLLYFLVGTASFWMKDIWGLNRIINFIIEILSGFLIPLSFFPPQIKQIVFLLPFASIFYFPASIYLGKCTSWEITTNLTIQSVWVLMLIFLGKWGWNRGREVFDSQGG